VGTWFPKLSEWVQNTKVTVGPPFYNNVAAPLALLLLLLTAIGPLLAWRRTSLESLKRNFLWPMIGSLVVGFVMIVDGVRPWEQIGYFYALVAAMLASLVIFTVISEFVRGGCVIARHTGRNLPSAVGQLWHRNTRRYGGYIVHFGVALVVIGILGTPFSREAEKEMGYGDKLDIGNYTVVCRSYTQDDNSNYSSEWAVLEIFKRGRLDGMPIGTMYPERRFYKASQQPQTMPQIHTRFTNPFVVSDLYLVYEGVNEDTGRPIIKAHVNPMVPAIWLGVLVMVFGTAIALVPNATPVPAVTPARVQIVPVSAGD